MKATAVLIEHLVGGILVAAASLCVLWNLFPAEARQFHERITAASQGVVAGAVAGAVLSSVAYSIGLIAEYAARAFFEKRWLDPIKRSRLQKYILENRQKLSKSPTLREFCGREATEIEVEVASEKIGQMRF